ncbi:BLOC-2 complex member HPS3-like isoform X2 [Liolophura sinensis]|uniref:BLOC-2 complex member HPS3-like isoform X2 n=1 Tax=Liolophura sinensis TaxID=3198878 RepID=UPI0031586A61
MVKVLRCYHFKSQAVIPCDGEPVALHASPGRLFVATADRQVEVYELGKAGFPKLCRFSTEASVTQIIYNAAGDYIATVETKKSILGEYKFVKVYLRWYVDQGRQPVKVRVAGKPPSLNTKEMKGEKAEVIDVPVSENILSITSCHTTSNLAVIAENKVFLYHLVNKQAHGMERGYQDILLFLQLNWDCAVLSVSLCQEYLACLNSKCAQLVKIWYKAPPGEEKLPTVASNESDDVETQGDCPIEEKSNDNETKTDNNQKDEEPFRGFSVDHSDSPNMLSFVDHLKYSTIGMRASPSLSNLAPESTSSKTGKGECETISDGEDFVLWDFSEDTISLQFGGEDSQPRAPSVIKPMSKTIFLKGFHAPSGGMSPMSVPLQGKPVPPHIVDHRDFSQRDQVQISVIIQVKQRHNSLFKGIQLIPTYRNKHHSMSAGFNTLFNHDTKEDEINKQTDPQGDASALPPPGISAPSSQPSTLGGLSCFLEAGYNGVMYSVLPTPHLLSHYKFASEALKVVCSPSVIHVITGVGVETYTSRCNVAALHNMETFDNITKTIPPPDLETCLVSIQPFIGTRQAAMSDRHLHLLTKVESHFPATKPSKRRETNWSLYVLEPSLVSDLYKDMVMLGTKNQESSPPTYLHLLLEGFIALKSYLMESNTDELKVLDLLSECCALLGDYYSQPGCGEWRLALPYYLMSGLTPEDILRQAVLHQQISKTSIDGFGQGLMNYLNYILFEDKSEREIKTEYCDIILKCYAEADPSNLSKVIMFGKYQNFDTAKAISLVEDNIRDSANVEKKHRCTDLLCSAVLNLRLCEPDKALSALSTVSKADVIRMCVENPQLLHTGTMELSPLSQLMRQHFSPVFITILVALQDSAIIPVDMALTLLKSNVYQSEVHRNTHVKEYLETLINDERRQKIFDEAATLLCDIYLMRLMEWKPPKSRNFPVPQFTMPKGSGFFGARFSWLDHMPPFYCPDNMKQPCQYLQFSKPGLGLRAKVMSQPIRIDQQTMSKDGCPCCLCNEDLLKLQAILSSRFVTEKIVRLVLDRLQGWEASSMYESLWLLCMTYIDFRQSVDILVEKYPSVLPEFLVGCIGKNTDKLRYTLESLICALRKAAALPTPEDNSYVDSVKGVLGMMAGLLPVDQFIQLLPTDGSLLAFLPYIIKCCQTEELHHLASQITGKGDNLRSGV